MGCRGPDALSEVFVNEVPILALVDREEISQMCNAEDRVLVLVMGKIHERRWNRVATGFGQWQMRGNGGWFLQNYPVMVI